MSRLIPWMMAVACFAGLSVRALDAAQATPGTPAPQAPATPAPAQSPAQVAADEDERLLRLAEPDFSVVNIPTTLRLPRHGANFRLTHRFLLNLRLGSFTDNLGNLFGLDNGAIVGFEFRYAPVRRLQAIVYRNNLSKTFQFSGQYDAIRQGGSWPVSLSAIVSIEGTNNFRSGHSDSEGGEHDHGTGATGHRSPALGGIVSRLIGDRLALYATPVWVHHTLANADGTYRDTSFVGIGGRARLTSKVYIVGEVSPRIGGYAPGEPEFAFGIERRAGGHMFLLTFTNSLSSTFGQVAQGGFPDTIYMGFNLGRKFF